MRTTQLALDNDGKLKQLPVKYAMRLLVYDYLAGKFEKEEHPVVLASLNRSSP